MRASLNAVTLSLFVFFSFNNDPRNRAEAAKLRRGSVNSNEEIQDLSEERALWKVGTMTDAERFALKKTPQPLTSSKCGLYLAGGGTITVQTASLLRKQHPGCIHFFDEEGNKDLATLPPIGAPDATTASPTTPLPTMPPTTPLPTAAPTPPLNCVQTVQGNELIIPGRQYYRKGDVHCLRGDNGQQAYFGYNWSNQFGLFVNGQPVWLAPEASVLASDRWTFQNDGNMLLRDSTGAGWWRTSTGGNWNSLMKVSFERVWIESNKGSTLWFEPLVPLPTAPPLIPSTPPTMPPTLAQTLPPTLSLTMPPVNNNDPQTPTLPSNQNQAIHYLDNLNCVSTETGTQLIVTMDQEFQKGEMQCLISEDGNKVAYFGYTDSNVFGLFVNSQAIWTTPQLSSFGLWNFQLDGNFVIRDSNRSNVWRSETPGNYGSLLIISFTQVWIETENGNTIWYQPPYPVTSMPTNPPPPTSSPTASQPTPPPSQAPTTSPPTKSPTAVPIPGVTPRPTTLSPTTSSPTTSQPSGTPTSRPTIAPSTAPTNTPVLGPTPRPTPPPTLLQHTGLNCVQTVVGEELSIPWGKQYSMGEVHCLLTADGQAAYFGLVGSNEFGLFANAQLIWSAPASMAENAERWYFQEDGNLVLRDNKGRSSWTSSSYGNYGSSLRVSLEHVWVERKNGEAAWSQPPYLGPPRPVPKDGYPDPNGHLQYYAYYYPWYIRNNWGRHGYQDEPLLGKYGTNEVAIAEQHIQWALETGITSWIVSFWGQHHLTAKHFKEGMLNAPSINQIKFCMLYESVILDGRGSWHDGSKEDSLYKDLKWIADEFFEHPSYLHINGRPVIIFYITRSRMPFANGFDGPKVLANMRRRLGYDVYFIADEPFFNPWNKKPSVNDNAFKDGKQVFDAYTTYNMYLDDRVRKGETASTYQLREGMPIWKEWAEQVPMFPNVMAQYYDFRGNQPLIGNGDDFYKQLREIACLPRTNFNGAPHIMFITSFNEWWEGTQIEPEDGSKGNWNNYGFTFMETLAKFKKEVDSKGLYWCNTEKPSTSPSSSPTNRPSTHPTALPSSSPTRSLEPSDSPTML